MTRSAIQLGLQLAGVVCQLACGSYWGGEFNGTVRAEKQSDCVYLIHQQDMPRALTNRWAMVAVDDSVKNRLIEPGEFATLRKRPGGRWTVEATDL